MSVRHLACAAEGAYDAHSAAMLRSAVVHAGGDGVHVHYLHGPGFPRRSATRIRRMVERLGAVITFHRVDPALVADLPVIPEFTKAMWYRLLLPELLPGVDRVLYLDADTIAMYSLDELWEIDLSGSLVAAVSNVMLDKYRDRPARLGLELDSYFNSGVLLMNLDEMRREGSSSAIREFAAARGAELEWPDQDALNVSLGRSRLRLHPRWNCMNALWLREARDTFSAVELAEAIERPAIRHFEGPRDNKPWHAACRRAYADRYFVHRRRTPWPWCRRQGTRTERLRRVARDLGLRRRR